MDIRSKNRHMERRYHADDVRYTHARKHTERHTPALVHTHTHAHTHTHTHTHTHKHTNTHTHMD
jgi:hypothetical protein